MPKRLLLALCLLLTAGTAAAADDLQRALAHAQARLSAGDYAHAYPDYLRLGKRSPMALFVVGLFHREGWGRPVDEAVACQWFEKAAAGKVPMAQHLFGACLERGIGRAADPAAALDWYLKAAERGDFLAYCDAADILIRGRGVAPDVARGLTLCTQAAQANSPPAMLKLAKYYWRDPVLPPNPEAARHWFAQAAAAGSVEAQTELGLMLVKGQGGETDVDQGLRWLETAAGTGYAPAYLPVAILYANAPLQADTGLMAPEHLAKVYLWTSLAKASAADPADIAEIGRIESLVDRLMPAAWRPELDQRVAEHLAKHPPGKS